MQQEGASVARKGTSEARLEAFCQAIADDLAMLARLHAKEPDAGLLQRLRSQRFPAGLGLTLESDAGHQAVELMQQAVASMPDVIEPAALDELASDYASIYLNFNIQASPEESVWVDEENLAYQDAMFQVRNWYARYGLSVPDWRLCPDDHLVYELQFLEHLFRHEATETGLSSVARFMDEHLLRWVTRFAERVGARCATPYFAGAARLTGAYCNELRDLLADLIGEARPHPDEIEQRMTPKRQREEIPIQFMPGTGPAV